MSRSASLSLSLLLLAGGCRDPLPTFDVVTEPMLYAVLHPQMDAYEPGVLREYALLATVGSPVRTEFIRAAGFVMTETESGAAFVWTECATADLRITPEGMDIREANYCLESGPEWGAGAENVFPGSSYDLDVTLDDGSRITAHTDVPAAFTVQHDAETHTLHWGDVPHAAMFSWSLTHPGGTLVGELATDTAVALPADVEAGTVIVYAFDEHLARYLSGEQEQSAGVTGAFGLFGSVVSAELTF